MTPLQKLAQLKKEPNMSSVFEGTVDLICAGNTDGFGIAGTFCITGRSNAE